jgi:hypothetical protein
LIGIIQFRNRTNEGEKNIDVVRFEKHAD